MQDPKMQGGKTRALWRNHNYVTLFTGQLLSTIGSAVYSFALLWDMKVLTDNTFLMSLVGIAWMLPQVIIGPFAGVFVDRWNKRWTMFWSDVIRLGITFGATALAMTGHFTPWEIILSALLLNTVGTVFGPAAGTLTPLVVEADQLASANGLEQASGPLSNIFGPAISAGLIAWHGVGSAYAVDAISFLVSVASLFFICAPEPSRTHEKLNVRVFFAELGDGFRAVREIRLMMALLPTAFLLNLLFAPFEIYMVQFVTVALHRTQVALGELNSLFAVGMIIGAVTAGLLSKRIHSGYLIAGSLLMSNIVFITAGLSSWFPSILVLMTIGGITQSWVNVPIFTMMQRVIPHEYRGRVFALIGTLFGGAMPIGILLGGIAARTVPIRDLFVFSGIIGGLLALTMIALPAVREADTLMPTEEPILEGTTV
ncbi:MAG: MFS transporter [Firmicutes bacterium]|nr:MFS transporter [Bacillota bacterium]